MASTKQTASIAINLLFSLSLIVSPLFLHQASAQVVSATLQTRSPSSRIQIRSAPSTQATSVAFGWAGDNVQVLNEKLGSDGYIWYYVKFATAVTGWVRGDLVSIHRLTNQTPPVYAQRPTSQNSNYPEGSPAPIAGGYQPALPPMSPYSQPAIADNRGVINYFMEIALGSEYGKSDTKIRKWSGPVRIQVFGTPSPEDLRTLESVIAEINGLVSGIRLELNNVNPNVHIYFAPESQFSRIEPNYQPTNYGFFWINAPGYVIKSARILITTTGVTQKERSHLIREELTQSLGLMNDSWKDPKSIFYQGWTDPTEYTEADRTLIRLLYSPNIRPGMNRAQVQDVFARSTP